MMFRSILILLVSCSLFGAELNKWTVVVYGSAEIEVDADEATIVYGVQQKGASMEDAFKKLRQLIDKVNKQLENYGVQEEDTYVSSFNSGEIRYGNSLFSKEDDYRASTKVTLTRLKVDQVENVLLTLGQNEIQNIINVSYRLKSDTEVKSKARAMALAAAREKALEMAKEMHVSIGNTLAIEELPGGKIQASPVIAAEKLFLASEPNPFNASMMIAPSDQTGLSAFYPEKISIQQYVRVVYHLLQ